MKRAFAGGLTAFLAWIAVVTAANGQPPPGQGPGQPPEANSPRRPDDSPLDRDRLPPAGGPRGKSAPGADERLPLAERLLRSMDRNGNGKLEPSEWDRIRDPERVDTNADGVITVEELAAAPRQLEGFGRGEWRGPGRGPDGPVGGRGGPGGPLDPRGFGFDGFGFPPPGDEEMRELLRQDAQFERQAFELASQVRAASGQEREKLKTQLAELVNKHFEVRQKRRELQVKRMEEELKRLREAIAERNESRDAIIKNRIAELIGDREKLDF